MSEAIIIIRWKSYEIYFNIDNNRNHSQINKNMTMNLIKIYKFVRIYRNKSRAYIITAKSLYSINILNITLETLKYQMKTYKNLILIQYIKSISD